jgi:hypothetical protein
MTDSTEILNSLSQEVAKTVLYTIMQEARNLSKEIAARPTDFHIKGHDITAYRLRRLMEAVQIMTKHVFSTMDLPATGNALVESYNFTLATVHKNAPNILQQENKE